MIEVDWVSIEDKIPPVGEPVIVWSRGMSHPMPCYYLGGMLFTGYCMVTHWAPFNISPPSNIDVEL